MPEAPIAPKPKPTRDQRRAQAAFDAIDAMRGNPEGKGDYGRYAIRLPALIHAAGLCQALAFLEAKSKKPGVKKLLDDFQRTAGLESKSTRTAGITEYQRMTREAMHCAEWFKRYSEAFLEGGD